MTLYKKYLASIPAMMTAIAIFWFSAQPADVSTDMSDGVSLMLLKFFDQIDPAQGTEYYKIIERMSLPIRKAAHVTEFTVFYCSLLFACYHWDLRWKRLLWTAFMLTVLYASADEFHQLFVPGRAGRITDVLIDSSGGFIISLVGGWRFRKKQPAN